MFFTIASVFPLVAFAQVSTLSKVRVFYRTDGGVSITSFMSGACREAETELQCMDRISAENPNIIGMPYDDIDPNQLPQDRTERNKWRGEKSRGVWIDHSLVSRNEKIQELNFELEKELDSDSPNPDRVIKLQRLLEKAKDMNGSILNAEQIAELSETRYSKSLFAAVSETASNVFSGIGQAIAGVLNGLRDGLLAIQSIFTQKIQIGSADKPSGITTYDLETRQPYCVVIRGGKIENIPGECTFEVASAQSTATPPAVEPTPAITLQEIPPSDITPPTEASEPATQTADASAGQVETPPPTEPTIDTSQPIEPIPPPSELLPEPTPEPAPQP